MKELTFFDQNAINNYMEFLISKRRFRLIDRILQSLIIKNFNINEVIEYLQATYLVKDKLDNRQYLINNARDVCNDQSILKHLE